MSENTLTITGNITAPPELRFTQSGVAVASFTLMQTKREKQGDQYVDGAKNGLRVTAWRDLAEHAAESLETGARVTVTGQLEPQQWQDRDTGANRYGWELNARDIAVSLRFHTAKPVKAERGGYQQGGQQRQQGGYDQQGQSFDQQDPWAGQQAGGYDDPPF